MASNTRIQGGRSRLIGRRSPSALALWLLAALGPATGAARELCRFEAGGLTVSAADASADGGLGVEINVADGPLVLTRLALPAPEGATACWHVDLDGDGQFEIIVGLVQEAGRRAPRLVRHEWNGRLLEAWSLPDLTPTMSAGYRGGDALSLAGGMLIRSFDAQIEGTATTEKRHFRYAPDAGQWMRLQALKRTGTVDAKTTPH